jgi:hypothetical protein
MSKSSGDEGPDTDGEAPKRPASLRGKQWSIRRAPYPKSGEELIKERKEWLERKKKESGPEP